MNKPQLESVLKKARLPEISDESLEIFPRRIVARLKRNEPPVHPTRHFAFNLAWAFGLAACVVIAFGIGHWTGREQAGTTSAPDTLASVKLIHETMAMFPNRVRAIVDDEHGLNLVLSKDNDVPASPPIYIRISDGRHSFSFVTFSGQEIQAGGQKLTVLSDAQGGIILAGEQFLWSNTGQLAIQNNLKISAKNLGSISM